MSLLRGVIVADPQVCRRGLSAAQPNRLGSAVVAGFDGSLDRKRERADEGDDDEIDEELRDRASVQCA